MNNSRAGSILCDQRGVALTELMIALAIMAIAVLGLIVSFGGLQKGIQMAKNKTLASNLAQEKMQIMKQQTYFRVVPTITPSYLPDGTPYDATTFPPETKLQGGITFNRYVYVQVVTENNGVLNILPATTPDTGMRQITITVQWSERGQTRTLAINSVMSNPNSVEANCTFTGTVTNAAPPNNPISGALVTVAENLGWRNSTNGSGVYTIQLSPGTYNLRATAQGFFSKTVLQTIGPNNTLTVPFSLAVMSSGSVTGIAWVNPNVVISQVVVSTPQANGYDVEYIELFNPTPNTVTVSGGLNLNYVSGNNNTQCTNVPLTYVNTTIPSQKYFVVANTTTFTVNGATVTADAYYTDTANASCSPSAYSWIVPTVRDIMHRNQSGTWWLTNSAGTTLDAVGWSKNGATHTPNSNCTGTCFYTVNGLQAGWELVRASSPTFFSSSYGRAYNSGNNSIDFTTSTTLQYSPFNSSFPAQTIIAGVPAIGAVVSATDGLSSPVSAVSAGSPPVAQFALTQVSTGTWSVFLTSGSYQLRQDTVTITAMGSVYTFPSSTTFLNQAATAGFISGTVTDVSGNPISAPSAIQVTGGGTTVSANTNTGYYELRVSTALATVAANPNFANPNYVSVSSAGIRTVLGQVHSGVNFVLAQGGRLSGFVTRDGINGLQGETITVSDANGNKQDQQITDMNGRFTTVNIGTGTYTVRIPLDSTESSSPTAPTATAVLGQTIFVATFTISGALGTITGNVTLSGKPISTGVLIVVATGTLPSGPPDISTYTLTTSSYYATSSREDGTYSLNVRQSTSPAYNVYGYYSTVSNGVVTITPKSLSNVPVTAGLTTSGQNLAW